MFFSKTAIALSLLPFSIAATCNSANATPYTTAVVIGGGGSTSGGSGTVPLATIESNLLSCKQSALTCLTNACNSYCQGKSSSSCPTACLSDVCSAFYGSGSDSPNQVKLTACYKAQNLKKRATLTCTSNQGCYSETNGNLFCLDTSNGNYNDIEGGQGNVKTGAYTSADAVKPVTTTTSGSTRTQTTSTTATGNAVVGTTATTATTATGSASTSTTATAAAPASTTAGMDKLHANVVVGAMGLVLGLVL